MKTTCLGLFVIRLILSGVRYPRLTCQTVTNVCGGIRSSATGMGQEVWEVNGMDCFSWRYDNGFKATSETMALQATCSASSSAFSCLQLVCACSYGKLLSVSWDSCFEGISFKRSIWTNSNWSWSPQTFPLYTLAVREWRCFIEVVAKHS